MGETAIAQELVADPSGVQAAQTQCRKRQRAWLLKSCEVAGSSRKRFSWRPAKRFRTGAFKNLTALDHQMKIVGLPGLTHFCTPQTSQHWASWPLLSLNFDQESVNVCSAHYIQYHLRGHVDIVYDMSHSAWNSVKAAVRASGYMGLMLSMLLVFNIPHGPWADDLRSSQVQQMLQDMCRQPWSKVLPLLEQRAIDVLSESRQMHLLTEDNTLESVWALFCHEGPFERKGSKVNLNRFMSTIIEGRAQLPVWTMRRVCYETIALEMDMLGSAKLQKLMVREPAASECGPSAGHEAPAATSSRRIGGIDKEVRKSCDNAVITACYILGMPNSWRRLSIFIECTSLVERWHSAQAKAVRSTSDASLWVVEQVGGQLMDAMVRLWAPLCLPVFVQRQGFWSPGSGAPVPNEVTATMEDQLAQESFVLTTNLLRQRLVRTLDMALGWPLLGMLASGSLTATLMAKLPDCITCRVRRGRLLCDASGLA